MGIFGRTQALVASNFNALLAKLEEPGRDIAQLLREMKQQIQFAERDLIRLLGERKLSESKLAELDAEVVRWEKRAALAVQHGDDALAREALLQKQRVVAEKQRLGVARAEQQQGALAMKAALERMKRTHEDFSSRQNTIATQLSQARAGGGAQGLGAAPNHDAFAAFNQIESNILGEEAAVAAQAEVDQLLDRTALGSMSNAELDERFRRLEADGPIVADASNERHSSEEQPSEGGADVQPRIRIEP